MKAFLFLCVMMTSMSLLADDLMVIHGGREIHGRVLEENPTSIFFYTDYGKKIQVHKSRISVLLRKGEVLAINPPVGNILGIRAENDVPFKGEKDANSDKWNINEPVTFNAQGGNREVASYSLNDTISNNAKGLRVGAIVGLTQSNASFSTSTSTTKRTGAEGGVVADYPLFSKVYLQSGFLLSQAGYVTGSTTVKYNYLKVPALIKYKRGLSDSFYLTGILGPSLGFRTQAVSEVGGASTDLKATTKSTIFGLDLGVGGEYVLTQKMGLFLNLNYSMQLNNLDTTIGGTTVTKLRQVSFLTGFLFTL